jgi:hypothetical protein
MSDGAEIVGSAYAAFAPAVFTTGVIGCFPDFFSFDVMRISKRRRRGRSVFWSRAHSALAIKFSTPGTFHRCNVAQILQTWSDEWN